MGTGHIELGSYGEDLVRLHLKEQGFRILDCNWRCQYGEIDIVGQMNDLIVFFEVKTRRGNDTTVAFEAVNPTKQRRLIDAIHHYLAEMQCDENQLWRVDVCAVLIHADLTATIEIVENALDW